MRLFKNIFVIVFVLASIYVVRDDVVKFFQDHVGDVKPFFARMGGDLQKELEDAGIAGKEAVEIFNTKITPVLPGPLAQISDHAGQESLSSDASEVVALVNKERISAGLKPYTANTQLTASAKIKVDDMIAKDYFEHVSPSGKSVSDLAVRAGYQYVAIGENLAKGDFYSSAELVDAWMNSPGHRANILSTKFTEIGVFIGYTTENDRQVLYAVQHFGLPRSACGVVDQSLRAEIDTSRAELSVIEKSLAVQKAEIDNYGEHKLETKNYDDLVSAYNSAIKIYNSLAGEIKLKVSKYNSQVTALNKCAQS